MVSADIFSLCCGCAWGFCALRRHLTFAICVLCSGMKASLYGDIMGHSDFELNLRPPGKQARAEQVLIS